MEVETQRVRTDQPIEECIIDANKTVYSFFAGNPIVEIVRGTIQLFQSPSTQSVEQNNILEKSKIVLVIGVPCYMSIAEFISYCGVFAWYMKHIRVIQDENYSKYMLLILFNEQKKADIFLMEFNGRYYCSMGSDICYLAYVQNVTFTHPKNASLFPPTGQSEIPTCTICLEKLDPSCGGILTILCNHSFHNVCLSQWRDENRCPICRYGQIPCGEQSTCMICGTGENLRLCLICGNIGCYESSNDHAEYHYKITQHAFTMDLDTQQVWDYPNNSFVTQNYMEQNEREPTDVDEFNWESELTNIIQEANNYHVNRYYKSERFYQEWEQLLEAHFDTEKEIIEDFENDNQIKIKSLQQEFCQLLEDKLQASRKVQCIERQRVILEKKAKELEKKMQEISKDNEEMEESSVMGNSIFMEESKINDQAQNVTHNIKQDSPRGESPKKILYDKGRLNSKNSRRRRRRK